MTGTPTGTITDRMQTELPALGQTMVWGRLRSMVFFVTRERVLRAIHDIDPIQTALQWRCELVCCHLYSVPGPNSLWRQDGYYYLCSLFPFLLHVTYTHFAAPIIDGHQKLIRWGMETYTAIDGFSRLVVYMGDHDTNSIIGQ